MIGVEKKGIGGWLVLYLIMIGIHSLIYFIALVSLLLSSSINLLFLLIILELLFLITAIILIFIKSGKAKMFNIITMLVAITLGIITYFTPNPSNIFLPTNMLSSFIISTLISVAWILYWSMSARVRNTFF